MPFTYYFLINKTTFDRRELTELQHRIRVPLKCYTVTGFKLNENNSFEFKKSNRKMIMGRHILITDDKLHHGSYTKEDIDPNNYKITVVFHD